MFIKTSDLLNYHILATDKELGKIKDLYIDETHWAIRYAVVDTRKWLPGKKVLIAASALDTVDIKNDVLKVSISSEKVKDCPAISDAEPVSRQYEKSLHAHYMWAPYWTNLAGPAPAPVPTNTEAPPPPQEMDYEKDNTLRSTAAINEYRVQSGTDTIGYVADFIIDDRNWYMDYAVIETGDWLDGRRVLLDRSLIQRADWKAQSIYVTVSREKIAEAPQFKEHQPLTQSYIELLENHYNIGKE